MSAYSDRFLRQAEQLPLAYACIEPLRDICPSVREIFCGVSDDDGIEIVKSASITFFMDGNRLKFAIRPKSLGKVGWGVVSECRKPFESIELALAKDEIDWKDDKFTPVSLGQTPSF